MTLRSRILRAASECEVLTSIYKQQLDVMSIDHSHASLRFVQFEFAQPRTANANEDDLDHEPSQTPDGRLDKITGQPNLLFAIQELDEGTLARLNFRQKDQWLQLVHEGEDSTNNLRVVLRLQIIHNHLLRTAILQHRIGIICITQQLQSAKLDSAPDPSKTPPTGKRHTSEPVVDASSSLLNNVLYENTRRKMFRENYFLSIQFEKTPHRDRMLNEFLRQRELKPMQYQQPREAEKLKRTLINDYVDRLHQRDNLLLLRLQIIQSYLNLVYLVQQFPLTSRTHFMWPKRAALPLSTTTVVASSSSNQEQKSDSPASTPVLNTVLTSNGYQSRPKQFLQENGRDLSNLWYLPSFMEQLHLFKGMRLDIQEMKKRLKNVFRIVSSLNDLVHMVVAFAQLKVIGNSAENRFSERGRDLLSFDQSGEFASELHEIQREIDELPTVSLSAVADLLETKRRLTIFQIYYAIGYLIPNSFLSAKNATAFDHVRSRSIPLLYRLVNSYDALHPVHAILPQSFLSVQFYTKQLYPWTVHQYRYNINAKSLWFPQHQLNDLIQIPLIGLKGLEVATANAELIRTQVMLQNIDEIIKSKQASAHMSRISRPKEVERRFLFLTPS